MPVFLEEAAREPLTDEEVWAGFVRVRQWRAMAHGALKEAAQEVIRSRIDPASHLKYLRAAHFYKELAEITRDYYMIMRARKEAAGERPRFPGAS